MPQRHRLGSCACGSRRRSALRIALEQRLRAHHHAGNAKAALRGLLLDESALHRAGIARACRALRASSSRRPCKQQAARGRKDRLAVDHHRARAALAQAAAELGAVELQIVAQNVEQRRLRIGVDIVALAIHVRLTMLPLSDSDRPGRPRCRGKDTEGRSRTVTRLADDLADILPGRLVAETAAQVYYQ